MTIVYVAGMLSTAILIVLGLRDIDQSLPTQTDLMAEKS